MKNNMQTLTGTMANLLYRDLRLMFFYTFGYECYSPDPA